MFLIFKNYFWLPWVFIVTHGLFIAVLRLSLVVANGEYSLTAVCGLLIAVSSYVAEHEAWGLGASEVRQEGSLSWLEFSCPTAGGIFIPRPRREPMSPASAEGFLTTRPPGTTHL